MPEPAPLSPVEPRLSDGRKGLVRKAAARRKARSERAPGLQLDAGNLLRISGWILILGIGLYLRWQNAFLRILGRYDIQFYEDIMLMLRHVEQLLGGRVLLEGPPIYNPFYITMRNGPFSYYLFALPRILFGPGIRPMLWFAILLDLAGVVLIWILARRLFGERVAWWSAAIQAVQLRPVVTPKTLTPPFLMTPFVLLFAISLTRAFDEERPGKLLVAALWLSLAVQMHITAAALLLALVAPALLAPRRLVPRAYLLGALVVFVLPFAPLVVQEIREGPPYFAEYRRARVMAFVLEKRPEPVAEVAFRTALEQLLATPFRRGSPAVWLHLVGYPFLLCALLRKPGFSRSELIRGAGVRAPPVPDSGLRSAPARKTAIDLPLLGFTLMVLAPPVMLLALVLRLHWLRTWYFIVLNPFRVILTAYSLHMLWRLAGRLAARWSPGVSPRVRGAATILPWVVMLVLCAGMLRTTYDVIRNVPPVPVDGEAWGAINRAVTAAWDDLIRRRADEGIAVAAAVLIPGEEAILRVSFTGGMHTRGDVYAILFTTWPDLWESRPARLLAAEELSRTRSVVALLHFSRLQECLDWLEALSRRLGLGRLRDEAPPNGWGPLPYTVDAYFPRSWVSCTSWDECLQALHKDAEEEARRKQSLL